MRKRSVNKTEKIERSKRMDEAKEVSGAVGVSPGKTTVIYFHRGILKYWKVRIAFIMAKLNMTIFFVYY